MRPEILFSLYAGPDQIMTVTSGLASVFGLLLIFWNKVVTTFYKVIGKSRPLPEPETSSDTSKPGSTNTP